MKNREKVLYMFLKKNYTAYDIHLKTGLSFKEITNYIKESEEAKDRHRRALRANNTVAL